MLNRSMLLLPLAAALAAPAQALACGGFFCSQVPVDQAEERITDLKERGFEKAGLYDPQGVGGTHVMYVLHHADQPSLYAKLPDEPTISPMVSLWKGIAKPLTMVALGAAALGSLFHYITKGPNEVSKELEDEMERKDREALAKEDQR